MEYGQKKSKIFVIRKDKFTLGNNIILWGLRVVIPYALRKRILSELHNQQVAGIVKMQALRRMHVWFPKIDQKTEGS